MALWDGRFGEGTARAMLEFSESLGTDMAMWQEDLRASVAHVVMLGEVGILTSAEAEAIVAGLGKVADELAAGWRPGIEHEDIHMAIEARLGEHVGELAGKLHTARSRNDQVATDVRLWLRRRMLLLDDAIAELMGRLLDRVERDGKALVPGFTHLQRGQPIRLGHHLLAHVWHLSRDRERLRDTLHRVNRSPLGAAAMAGTPHPIDRSRTAELLQFEAVLENAMDAVSARDHVLEAAADCAILMAHLSRLAEELVLWSTREFGWITLSDSWSTGSSIMPQKRNPDAPELVRGKAGRVFGDLQALLSIVKGLPLAYNRDLQEDRTALFDSVSTTLACVRVLAGCIETMAIHPTVDLRGDLSLATELADFLVTKGVPFREAHRVAGGLVKSVEGDPRGLAALTAEDLRQAHPKFDASALAWLDPEKAVERRSSRGGTAWDEVLRQVGLLRASLR